MKSALCRWWLGRQSFSEHSGRVVGKPETEPKGLPSGSEPRHATKRSGLFPLEIVKRFRNNFGTLRVEMQGKPPALQSRHFHLNDWVGLPSVPRGFTYAPTLPCC